MSKTADGKALEELQAAHAAVQEQRSQPEREAEFAELVRRAEALKRSLLRRSESLCSLSSTLLTDSQWETLWGAYEQDVRQLRSLWREVASRSQAEPVPASGPAVERRLPE